MCFHNIKSLKFKFLNMFAAGDVITRRIFVTERPATTYIGPIHVYKRLLLPLNDPQFRFLKCKVLLSITLQLCYCAIALYK